MVRLLRVRTFLIALLTSAMVALGYELRSSGSVLLGLPTWLIAMIAFGLGGGLARLFTDGLLSLGWIRSRLSGSAHVEGFWYLSTDGDEANPLSPDGILYIYHVASLGETRVVTTRLNDDKEEYPTVSEIAYVRGDGIDHAYVNYFRLTYPGPTTHFGLSSGRFIKSDSQRYPNRLEAHISVTGDTAVRRQSAVRIPERVVASMKREHGQDWMRLALEQGRDGVFHTSPKN